MNAEEYVNSLFNLEGRVGIITGATRGLGMAMAKVLTDAGAKVYNFSRRPRSDELEITGDMVDVLLDITDTDKMRKAVEEVVAREGKLDFLINNAGMQVQHLFYFHRVDIFAAGDNHVIFSAHNTEKTILVPCAQIVGIEKAVMKPPLRLCRIAEVKRRRLGI